MVALNTVRELADRKKRWRSLPLAGGLVALGLASVIGCASVPEGRAMLDAHTLYNDEILNQRKLDLTGEVFALNYVSHDPTRPDLESPEAIEQMIAPIFEAFPDIMWTVNDRFVSDDRIAVRWSATGTHKKDFMGIPATGKKIVITGLSVHRFEGTKIVETWDYADYLGLMQQLTGQ